MSFSPDPTQGKNVFDLDRHYVFHSWSAQGALNPMCIAAAEGSYVWDYDGNKWLDFSSQLVNVNIGHQHPKLVAAIKHGREVVDDRSRSMRTTSVVKLLSASSNSPRPNMAKVFSSPTAALMRWRMRFAWRASAGKHRVLSTYRSYHGNTGAAITATGDPRRWPDSARASALRFSKPYPYRSPFWSDSPEQETERALQHLEQVIQFEGEHRRRGVLESVVGTAGILVPAAGTTSKVRCVRWRTNTRSSGSPTRRCPASRAPASGSLSDWDAQPDLIVFTKSSNSGYVPIEVVISGDITATFDDRVFRVALPTLSILSPQPPSSPLLMR